MPGAATAVQKTATGWRRVMPPTLEVFFISLKCTTPGAKAPPFSSPSRRAHGCRQTASACLFQTSKFSQLTVCIPAAKEFSLAPENKLPKHLCLTQFGGSQRINGTFSLNLASGVCPSFPAILVPETAEFTNLAPSATQVS